MAKIYGQLERAQVENVGALPSAGIKGRVVFYTVDSKFYFDDGTALREIFSPTSTVPITAGGTGQTAKTDAFDALAPTTTAGDIVVHNGSDNVRQGIGTDGQVLVVDTALGNKLKWTTLQQGAKNYITYNNFENGAITGWKEASVSWSGGAPSGAATINDTAATSIVISTTNTNPLAGSYSMQMVGTIAQGEGFCTDALTIDREDQAKVLQGSFYYEVVSGAADSNWSGTSSNTLAIWIYDVTNSAWIQPAGVYNLVQSSGQGFCTFTFQTPATISQLRLFVFAANAATGSITVNFDDFVLGPQKILSGPAVSDEVEFTPVLSGITSIGNGSLYFQWKRVGDCMHILGEITAGSTTTYAGGAIGIALPTGFSQDATEQSNLVGLGQGFYFDSGTQAPRTSGQVRYSAGYYYVLRDGGSFVTDTDPSTWASGDSLNFDFRVKIAGWSSNTVMSSDTDTRVVSFRGFNSSTQAITQNVTNISAPNVQKDTHGAWNGSVYTIPISGDYAVQFAGADVAGGLKSFNVWINGSQSNRVHLSQPTSSISTGSTLVVNLVAGDQISVRTGSTSFTLQGGSSIDIFRLSGPATIAASETVACAYATSTATSLTNASDIVMKYTTKDFDTHNAYDTVTGKFTAPISGKYLIIAGVSLASDNGWAVDERLTLEVWKNGVNTFPERKKLNAVSGLVGTSIAARTYGSAIMQMNAGDYVEIYVNQNSGASIALDGVDFNNHMSVERIGN